jgi:hypothetical protein
MALRTSQRLLLAKEESSYNTDPTPTGAANAVLVRSLEISPFQSDVVERELVRGYMGNYETLRSVRCLRLAAIAKQSLLAPQSPTPR